jgi:hypothetical protein
MPHEAVFICVPNCPIQCFPLWLVKVSDVAHTDGLKKQALSHSPIQAPILDRFGDVQCFDVFRAGKVGADAADFENAAVGSCVQVEFVDHSMLFSVLNCPQTMRAQRGRISLLQMPHPRPDLFSMKSH